MTEESRQPIPTDDWLGAGPKNAQLIYILYSLIAAVLVFVLIGILAAVAVVIWAIIRLVKGLMALGKQEPIADPQSWLI